MRRRVLFYIIGILLAILFCGCQKPQENLKANETAENIQGNTSGNINNGGYVADRKSVV